MVTGPALPEGVGLLTVDGEDEDPPPQAIKEAKPVKATDSRSWRILNAVAFISIPELVGLIRGRFFGWLRSGNALLALFAAARFCHRVDGQKGHRVCTLLRLNSFPQAPRAFSSIFSPIARANE
jgi:hypothetical protein